MEKRRILQIALPTPLRQTFDYLPPLDVPIEKIKIGLRVKVPFGRRQSMGMIIHIADHSLMPTEKLKQVGEIIDSDPLLTPNTLALYHFASQYYQYPIGEVIFSSLPPSLRDGTAALLPEETVFTLTELGAATDASLKHAVQQQKLIQLLKMHPNGLSREEIIAAEGQPKALTALLAKGFVRKHLRKQACVSAMKKASHYCKLNAHQNEAVKAIINQAGFGTFLLEGVTGSGKTEVYLHCIDHILNQGKQALILVPEIGLTPQTVARFQSRFAVPISILHSGLTDKERSYAWLLAMKGIARIIIGTRSAILTPLPDLGIIILDEEHDASFKQQSGFRYSAKDLAVVRGKLESVPVVLGSATPCLESVYNARQSRFSHLCLPKRAGNALEPLFHIVDVRNKKLEEGFAPIILERMQKHIEQQGQILVFLNRRGFAPTLLCHHCGWMAGCASCDARLTYHAHLEKLICHHCARTYPVYKQCGACQSTALVLLGLGTQRLEKLLTKHFPITPIIRIDRDSTRRKGAMENMLAPLHKGGSQILVGTQMLAKGHHFPDITMVAVIDIDSGLYSADFRASERLGQIIVQVAGRAGRSSKPGEVYLQTYHPEHPCLQQLVQFGYPKLADLLLSERKTAELPPYSHLALFRAEAADFTQVHLFLSEIRQLLAAERELQVFGPIPALMKKKAGKFRGQLLVQTKQRSLLQKSLSAKLQEIEMLPFSRKVRWSLDVDPIDVL